MVILVFGGVALSEKEMAMECLGSCSPAELEGFSFLRIFTDFFRQNAGTFLYVSNMIA